MGWGRFGERLTDTQGERLRLGRRERERGEGGRARERVGNTEGERLRLKQRHRKRGRETVIEMG